MGAPEPPRPAARGFVINPLAGGGWRVTGSSRNPTHDCPEIDFPADWRTDPTGEAAYAAALAAGEAWRSQSPPPDRRDGDHPLRQDLTLLRLIEMRLADHLPEPAMRAFTAAVDAVVHAARQPETAP